jgi:hypothetical protein
LGSFDIGLWPSVAPLRSGIHACFPWLLSLLFLPSLSRRLHCFLRSHFLLTSYPITLIFLGSLGTQEKPSSSSWFAGILKGKEGSDPVIFCPALHKWQ